LGNLGVEEMSILQFPLKYSNMKEGNQFFWLWKWILHQV